MLGRDDAQQLLGDVIKPGHANVVAAENEGPHAGEGCE
jgi:nitrogenase subunit NifH